MIPTPAELGEVLVAILTGAAGGSEERWRDVVGEVRYLPLATNVLSNWSIAPKGTAAELEAAAKAEELVRAEHPYVALRNAG
jgi:hypothetical protein